MEKRREMPLNEQIAAGIVRVGISRKELALRVGLSPSAFYDRCRHPDKFRIGELKQLTGIIGELEVRL